MDQGLLEDDQFKRARLDTSAFPHYELKSASNESEESDSYDDGDGEFPMAKMKEIKNKIKNEKLDLRPNTLYVFNYWNRYNELVLNWPNCDGECGNKFGKLIHNALYAQSESEESKSNGTTSMQLYIDNYQLNSEDITAINFFSSLNPINIASDTVISMWSFLDSLKVRVNEYNKTMTDIKYESKVHALINEDIEKTLNIKEVISKDFLCYSTPIRRYLISLLDSFEECNLSQDTISDCYQSLLKTLKDKENIICDEEQTLDIWSKLTNIGHNCHYFILYQLSRYSCCHQSYTLFNELKKNGFHTIYPDLYTKDIVRIIKTAQYKQMRKYNLELSAEEIISILIYTASDEISKGVRESLIRQQRSCKWMKLTDNLVSAVDKMHKCLVQTKSKSELPKKLYYAIGSTKINKKSIKYFDVLSLTENVDLALRVMNKGTMIIFDDANSMLQTSRFVAAPLNWITAKDDGQFSEWLVMNCKIHQTVHEKSNDKKHRIVCTEYETISIRSMSTWRKVVDAAMILDQTQISLLKAVNSAILSADCWQCIHCQCVAPIYFYQGNVLMDNMECAFCRRFNIFSFNVPERIVSCFECEQESMLREYVIDYNGKKGAACPKCKVFQCDAFLKSKQFDKMKAYLSETDAYERKLKEKQRKKKQVHIPSSVSGSINSNSVVTENENTFTSFFRWGKRKSIKSSNLNNIKENPSIIEDDFD